MSSFRPESYAEALSLAQKRPRKIRTPLKPGKGIQTRSALHSASGTRNSAPKPKAKRAKRLSDGKLKKKVWKQFSIFIRTRGADLEGINACFTCGARKFWTELQAGHFVRGRLNANLFDGRGCHPQCYSCNIGKQGNVIPYYKRMLKQYGQMVIDSLVTQNEVTRKWLPGELQDMHDRYKGLNDANPITKLKKN